MTASSGFDHVPNSERAGSGPRRLHRSRTNRMFAGVCGGIAEYYGSDPTSVRLLAVVIAVLTAVFPLLIVYLVAAIVMPDAEGPERDGASNAAAAYRTPGNGTLLVGVLLVVLGTVALGNQLFRVNWDVLGPMVLVVMGGAIVFTATRRRGL